jgi:hypothetical protein
MFFFKRKEETQSLLSSKSKNETENNQSELKIIIEQLSKLQFRNRYSQFPKKSFALGITAGASALASTGYTIYSLLEDANRTDNLRQKLLNDYANTDSDKWVYLRGWKYHLPCNSMCPIHNCEDLASAYKYGDPGKVCLDIINQLYKACEAQEYNSPFIWITLGFILIGFLFLIYSAYSTLAMQPTTVKDIKIEDNVNGILEILHEKYQLDISDTRKISDIIAEIKNINNHRLMFTL